MLKTSPYKKIAIADLIFLSMRLFIIDTTLKKIMLHLTRLRYLPITAVNMAMFVFETNACTKRKKNS
jgi:hypothetical protein